MADKLLNLTADGSWATAGNWLASGVPVSTDTVKLRASEFDVNAGFAQSAVVLASLSIEATHSGDVGTAADYLAIGATLWDVGLQSGSGSGVGSSRIKLNFGTDQFTGHVYLTQPESADLYLEPLRILGTHASNELNVHGGIVGVATTLPSEVSTIAVLNMFGGECNLGGGVTLGDVFMTGASSKLTIRSAFDDLSMDDGSITIYGSGVKDELSIKGGTLTDYGTGTADVITVFDGATLNKWSDTATITDLYLYGVLDLSGATGPITVTNFHRLSEDAQIIDPLGRLVATNGIINGPGIRRMDNYRGPGGQTFKV